MQSMNKQKLDLKKIENNSVEDNLLNGMKNDLKYQTWGLTKEQHIGFETSAWYWHFVDVVWLVLFAVVYFWWFL